jgi:hypothetical protein
LFWQNEGKLNLNLFTKLTGRLPVGIWIVLALLIFAFIFGPGGQAVSVISWETAISIGLQEDHPDSKDVMERSLVPIEWGTAVADVILQTIVIMLALYGIIRRRWIGLAAATMQFIILIYAALLYFFQRYGIKVWSTGDWTRWQETAIFFLVFAGSLGILGLVCVWSNRKYFKE